MTNIKNKVTILLGILSLITNLTAWSPDIEPKLSISDKKVMSFFGNSTDYFKILALDDTTILIGAKNAVYNLSLYNLRENDKQRIEWSSTDADRELCALKGKLDKDCQNYIRVFARISDTQIMICGTNSYKPRCRYYANKSNGVSIQKPATSHQNSEDNNNNNSNDDSNSGTGSIPSSENQLQSKKNNKSIFDIVSEVEAQGRCPYNPQHNSTYIYTDGQLYSATVADFSGADPLIYRETLRTEQYDLKQLNQPAFVSALERNGYVFFFFREIAMEYMNCGKSIYSRVGRVCKNDRGGPYAFNDRWTSFLKTRLNCSVPGEYPFYFDEIQATSQIIDGRYQNGNKSSVIYAVFTTSINAIPGSAVCAFSTDDILDAFEGRFKFQKDSHSNWLPLSPDSVPEPRPGQCVDDSRTISSTSANFVKTHTLMETSIAPLYGQPLLTRVQSQYRLTAIAVDPQILALDGNTYDVIFAGTDSGKIVKFINIPTGMTDNDIDPGNMKTIVIAEIEALPKGMAIKELTISHQTLSLIVLGDGHIVTIPLHHCSQLNNCNICLQAQDPYCVWDNSNQECKSITSAKIEITPKNFIQSLNSTEHLKMLCEKFGDIGNNIDNNKRIKTIDPSTRGTVSGIGKAPSNGLGSHSNNNNNGSNSNNGGAYQNHKITLTSFDPADIDDNNRNNQINIDDLGIEGETLKLAGRDFYWGYLIFILAVVVFIIGVAIGWYSSKRLCKSLPFHAEHRNQLTPKPRTLVHRSRGGKDVNLLMNANTTNTFTTQCNNKKDNIEHEFVVGDKDRSHECKNSTENLEKEVHKTGTLTKVKRTYI